MKTIRYLLLGLVAGFAFLYFWNSYQTKAQSWLVIQKPDGKFAYTDWGARVGGSYDTCEQARADRDHFKKWSDDYDAGRLAKPKERETMSSKFKIIQCP
jgi:hypothetical protein